MGAGVRHAAAQGGSMCDGLRRHLFRRRVCLYIAVLLCPDKERKVRRALRDDVERWMAEGRPRGWSPQTVAAVTMAGHLIHVVRNDLTLLQRERYLQQFRELEPKDLIAELQWLLGLKDGAGANMQPFVFRLTFMNCMLASWLVRDKTIDMYTKSVFVPAVASALAAVDLDEIYLKVAGLADQIGTAPQG